MRQICALLMILFNRRITSAPRRVLAELRRRGIHRLPGSVDRSMRRKLPGMVALKFLHGWLRGELLSRHKGVWVLNSFTPPFPTRSFERAFENLLSPRKFSPISAFLAVTSQCPNHCWHCSQMTRTTGHLRTMQWENIIEQLSLLGSCIVGFTGGEPLTRADLPRLVGVAARNGATTIVFTSGAGLTETRLEELVAAGLWSMCISLDHPVAQEHNRLRGNEAAYETALESIRRSRAAGLYTMIGSVATRSFVENRLFEDIYRIARTMGVHEYRLVEPMPCGTLRDADNEGLLSPDHVKALRQFHVETNRRGRLPKVCSFNQLESPEVFGCAGGIQHLYVDSAGEVCPCDFTPLSFGNASREPMSEIWQRMNAALERPRRNCMLQSHHALFSRYYHTGYPVPPETSLEICRQMPREPLPDYYAMVAGVNEEVLQP